MQGCLRLDDVPYGLTADTGGHIKYLLELVAASAADPAVDRIDIVTRGFRDRRLGQCYEPGVGARSAKVGIVRLEDSEPGYLAKEELWQQHDRLCEAFMRYLTSAATLPDLIHAHYADAGILAARAREEIGIPFVFTGHSLGAVKRQANGGQSNPALERRIAIEERVLTDADAVIASSRDEAEVQYAHYRSIEPGRIRVIPPGCELDRFRAARVSKRVRTSVDRFLSDPAKPIILAIARPVRKKNLMALVEAFASDADLQDRANLVIVAGCRGLLGDLEDECEQVLRELIEAVDRFDLYGKIAYPKSHESDDIPAFYALARESGGLFVNPALNEPFGLTLLEAAASRVPVVATDSGGPNDIVERCKNGVLVCPTDRNAIAEACRSIIADRRQWIRYASAGGDAAAAFAWPAHCSIYHRLIADLVSPYRDRPAPQRLLICDIDNTLLGDRKALKAFLNWQSENHDEVALGIATGRSFHSAQAILAAEGVPAPDVVISSVGTQIHWFESKRRCFVEDEKWRERLETRWDPEQILAIGEGLGLCAQGRLEQRKGKASFFLGDVKRSALEKAFFKAGLDVEIIASHGRYLDILPGGVSKGAAVLHVADRLSLPQARLVVAGDSGNDLAMLRACPHPIVVGNWSDGLGEDPSLDHAYVARGCNAAGVLEGVRYYLSSGSW